MYYIGIYSHMQALPVSINALTYKSSMNQYVCMLQYVCMYVHLHIHKYV